MPGASGGQREACLRVTAGENPATPPGEGVKFGEDGDGLGGQGHKVVGLGLGDEVFPFTLFQIDVFPFGLSEFAGTDKQHRCKQQGGFDGKGALEGIHGAQKRGGFPRFGDGGEVFSLGGGDGALQIRAGVAFCPAGDDGKAEGVGDFGADAMSGVAGTPGIDAPEHGEDFHGGDIGDGPFAQPGEDIVFHAGQGFEVLRGFDGGFAVFQPLPADQFKGILGGEK